MIEDEQKWIDISNMRNLKKNLPERLQRLLFFMRYKLKSAESILPVQD